MRVWFDLIWYSAAIELQIFEIQFCSMPREEQMNSDCIQLICKWTVTKVSICIHYVYGACLLSRPHSQVHKQGIKSYRLCACADLSVCVCVYLCRPHKRKEPTKVSLKVFLWARFLFVCPSTSSSCVVKLKIIFTFYFIFMFAPRKFFLPFSCFPIAGHRRV